MGKFRIKKNAMALRSGSEKNGHPVFDFVTGQNEDGSRKVDYRKTGYIDPYAAPFPLNIAKHSLQNTVKVAETRPDQFGFGFILYGVQNQKPVEEYIHTTNMIWAAELLHSYDVSGAEVLIEQMKTDPELCKEILYRFMPSVSYYLDSYDGGYDEVSHQYDMPIRHTKAYAAMMDPDFDVRWHASGFAHLGERDELNIRKFVTQDGANQYDIASKLHTYEDEQSNSDLYKGKYAMANAFGLRTSRTKQS